MFCGSLDLGSKLLEVKLLHLFLSSVQRLIDGVIGIVEFVSRRLGGCLGLLAKLGCGNFLVQVFDQMPN